MRLRLGSWLASALGGILAVLLFSGCSSGSDGNKGGNGSPVPRTFQFGELQGTSSVDPSGFLQRSANGTNTTALLGVFSTLALQNPTRMTVVPTIVFHRSKINDNDLYRVNPDGTGESLLNPSDHQYRANPNLSADASKIAYNLGNDIHVMKSDGTSDQLLVTSGVRPKWSPDGTKVAFSRFTASGSHVFLINADGTGLTQVTTSGPSNFEPNWFPTGLKLVFVSNRGSLGNLYSINIDGTNETRLTNNSYEEHNPAVSPDGMKIVLYRFISGGVTGTYTINSGGSGDALVLAGASQANWSLDGNSLLASYIQSGSGGIFSIGLNGIILGRVTTTSGVDDSPSIGVSRPSNASLIGALGVMGGTATGYIYSSTGGSDSRATGTPRSLLTFSSSASPSQFATSLPADQNMGNSIVYRIEAKDMATTLGTLQYWNFSQPIPTTVDSLVAANGVLVTYDTTQGEIATVAPYALSGGAGSKAQVITQGRSATLKGNFLGVWNGKGQRIAPAGTRELTLDATGRPVSIR